MLNRFNIDVRKMCDVTAHHPRGGTVTGTVVRLFRENGVRCLELTSGHTFPIDDVKECTAPPQVYCTSYCNKPHRMRDGKPVDHECYVLPPLALAYERYGLHRAAIETLEAAKPFRTHRGCKASTPA